MRYLLTFSLTLSACSGLSPTLGAFYFDYEISNQKSSNLIQVFDDGKTTYFKVAPGFKNKELISAAGIHLLEGEGSLKVCSCTFQEARLGSSLVKRIPQKKRQRTLFDAI